MPHAGCPCQFSTETLPVSQELSYLIPPHLTLAARHTPRLSGRWAEESQANQEAGSCARPGGLEAGERVRLPTCFCSSFSPLIASSTGNSEWARWETRQTSGDSGVRSLQLVTRRPSSQAAVAISSSQQSSAVAERSQPFGLHQSRALRPPPIGEEMGFQEPITLRCPLKAKLALAKTRSNQW